MKNKTLTAEQLKKQAIRREKEIARWEKEKARPKRSYYIVYLILIISLIYAVDEIASQIGTLMKTEIANDLFKTGNSASLLDILSGLAIPFQAVGLLYRPLADRWGRKLFLIINTFGMSAALLVIYLSDNIPLYFIGACIVQFFIPHDMHVVYIMESSPSKHRARIYSSIKFFANIAVMLVPYLRDRLMTDVSEWRNVYFIPAVVGVVVCFIALMCARETDAFIESRLAYLRKTPEELEREKKAADAANKQGGLIPALKFALKHKQLRWLYIVSSVANIGFIASINYPIVLNYGYASNLFASGAAATLEEAVATVGVTTYTEAIFLYPLGLAIAQVIMGFISDWKGRKAAAVTTAFNCVLSYVLFSVGAYCNWNPLITGFFCGAAIGSYYSTNDVIIMMIGESAPTNLRSSAMSAQYIVTAVGFALSFILSMPFTLTIGNTAMAACCFALLVPGFTAALVLLIKKTHDTTGIDMDTVTGTEWD